MQTEAIAAEIERLGPWLHDMDVAGIRTGAARGSDDPDRIVRANFAPDLTMERLIGPLYGGSLGGRSFLDCGCNAGGHSFAAARMGAGRSFAFDARQYWLDQAAFAARFHDAPQLRFGCHTLADLPALGLEPFDVTLFSGLFYHLPDPVAGLRIAADLTRELLIVNTAVLPRSHRGLVINPESATIALSGVDGLAWLPTGPAVLADIFRWCGFPHVRVEAYFKYGARGWWRTQMLAARDASVFERFDRERPDARLELHRSKSERLRCAAGRVRRALRL